MTKEKEILGLYQIMLLYHLSKKETLEQLLKLNFRNKQMRDLHKSHSQLQEILIYMKIEVRLRLVKSYNKYKLLKINLTKKEDQGNY